MDFFAPLFAVLAQQSPDAAAPAPPSLFNFMLPLLFVFALYILVIERPSRRERMERENRLSALKKGDRVVTIGGMCGKVDSMSETRVTLQFDKNTRIEFLKTAIDRVEEKKSGKPSKEGAAAEETES
jgi:preprotein translocase subunit YajC